MTLVFADGRRVDLHAVWLSPWSRTNLDPDELERLEQRATALGVSVSALAAKNRRGYVVRVFTPERVVTLRGQGPSLAVIAGALDDWEQAA